MPFDEFITEATKTSLDQYGAIQGQLLEANRTLAETVGKIAPAPFAGAVPSLVDPKSVVDGSFDAFASILDANKRFVTEMAGIWAPAEAG